MKRTLFFMMFLAIAAAFSLTSLAQEKPKTEEKKAEKKEVVEEKQSVDKAELNTICPVSKEEADGEITAEYKGKKYALCCKSCLKKFNKDPEKYISRLSEDGKSIKKK